MIGHIVSYNGEAISWRSSRQGGVLLSSAEPELVAASQAGQEVVCLVALLRGFKLTQVGPTEIRKDFSLIKSRLHARCGHKGALTP